MKLLQRHKGLLSFLLLVVIASVVAVACQGDTQNAQTNQTQQNLTQINAVQQVPNVTYSQRLQVLFDYYGQVLNRVPGYAPARYSPLVVALVLLRMP